MERDELVRLRELIEAATPGPWGLTFAPGEKTQLWSDAPGFEDEPIAVDPHTQPGTPGPDMAYIMAVNPLKITAVLEALERADFVTSQLRSLADWHETKAEKARLYRDHEHATADQVAAMDKAAEVHDEAAQRIRRILFPLDDD